MDSIDLSLGQQVILRDALVLDALPEEILEIISCGDTSRFLDAIATGSLLPALTLRFFARFEYVFADICARWIALAGDEKKYGDVIEAFARIITFAPHLSVYLERFLHLVPPLSRGQVPDPVLRWISGEEQDCIVSSTEIQLQRLLLAALRLINFDKQTFAPIISVSRMQSLLEHSSYSVRYLAIRIICRLLSASDMKLEELIDKYVGKAESIMGYFDDQLIDYGFFSLYEEKRAKDVEDMRKSIHELSPRPQQLQPLHVGSFSPLVSCFEGVLLPRPNGEPNRRTSLVPTRTTLRNKTRFAKALLSSSPILIHGLAGSGKTSLVSDFARELGKDPTMITLHLNEQTDAKMLVGMYSTSTSPGSFIWRPGVLTTAVRESRWVFIEDLDRAPNEVISVILPLIERGELFIPSRGETARATPGFRLIASIRTSSNISGKENPPTMHMLGARLWNRVHVEIPSHEEFLEIIDETSPILHNFLPEIRAVFERLYTLSQEPTFSLSNRVSFAQIVSPRDLLKWCRRLNSLLLTARLKTGNEQITESTKDEMFMEAMDCFTGNLQLGDARKAIIFAIAEEMHIPLQRVQYYLEAYVPRYEESDLHLQIGRVKLSKRLASSRVTKSLKRPQPFANTAHARRLLEQVGVALKMAEPVLLVGETGIGKTTVVQQLADLLGYKLTAVNLSQQSEVGDLLGGFKPINVRSLAVPLKEEFDELFVATGMSANRNQKYLEQLGKCIAKGQWSRASKLWHEAPKMFERILSDISELDAVKFRDSNNQPAKRQKTESKLQALLQLKSRWEKFSKSLDQFDAQLSAGSKSFAFTFIEGNIVRAARNGEWVLLDEINLAPPDTLESITDLLHSGTENSPSILLTETGEVERIRAHPDFRIFGAMNPATDVGKRDLPVSLRTQFTEIYVESPDRDQNDLHSIIKAYLKGSSGNDERAAHDIARLYINTKRLADEKRLVDGANQVPHFSLRTLTRVLGYVMEIAPSYGLRRALYEGYAMGFLTLLDRESERMLTPLMNHYLLDSHGNAQSLLAQTPKHPEDGRQYIRFMNKRRDRQYWMLQGHETLQEQLHYIITPFVERNMLNLVRATSTRKFPVLVQGPTSSGKTSMIEYLAKFSGNKFVRINNHEHTDLQEYLGSYISGSDGQLQFQEGLLVKALREGHWIVLDELNLAPTDVLEALNRLLDDNRELLIPETQEVVRPHENFMLFATQNPPGLYGGRKVLSRAFRNRFLELHFDDIPEDELEFILEKRSQKVAPSDCKRIVTVYKELSRLRQSNRLFEQKDSFATLRDLFRWASRDAENREQLAAHGYMLLAERVRKDEERVAVKEIIERVMKVKLYPNALYAAASSPEIMLYDGSTNKLGVVWTHAMRRLYVLVAHALRNNEPVLLVGETGCGKTTVCQMLAEAFGKKLHIVNAHQNTETGDLIGSQRPIRNRVAIIEQLKDDLRVALYGSNDARDFRDLDPLLNIYQSLSSEALLAIPGELRQRIKTGQLKSKALFEWCDGSLIHAMKEGQHFLLDEISLADDSVLERLNSVLESQRTILLAEKGVEESFVQSVDGFQFFATMNPGGDYGKRELSPALRNRFTEIWVPSLSDHEDILHIVEAKLTTESRHFAKSMVDFTDWFGHQYRSSAAQSISIRDLLSWVSFINRSRSLDPYFTVLHGAAMVYIDTIGANPAGLLEACPDSIRDERAKCLRQLSTFLGYDVATIYAAPVELSQTEQYLTVGNFSIEKTLSARTDAEFAFEAPTTKLNAMRVVRALQVQKPILIEGSPGVGKTTLVTALAKAVGIPLTRINLSEQTDLMDLFGSDMPVEGGEAGNFAWRDAPFLQAMQRGHWVLLDEMNLASQSVLEGLNACLDHRGEVYISELDKTFRRHQSFCVFAAQNPHHQGGGRKGLPSSFVNRFTVVYADVFRNDDLILICRHNFPKMNQEVMSSAINFVYALEQEVVYKHKFGAQGAPWEFNLRDILRWLQLLTSSAPILSSRSPADFLNLIFRQRFRTLKDRQEFDKIFLGCFRHNIPLHHLFHNLAQDAYQVGMAYLPRKGLTQVLQLPDADVTSILPELESVMLCIQQNIPCILVGSPGSGKSSLIQHVAAVTGAELLVFPLNAEIDTMDLVGGFEQVDPHRKFETFMEQLCSFLETHVLSLMPEAIPREAIELLYLCRNAPSTTLEYSQIIRRLLVSLHESTSLSDIKEFLHTCQSLINSSVFIEGARFEWVDSILIKAIKEGKWLVLDNANLCSSSVLDRLNSLLEPNGLLTINENNEPCGEPRVVIPHSDFRIFLTMDPRFGELSRAMRNRCVEIYLGVSTESTTQAGVSLGISHRTDTTLQRYRCVVDSLQDERIHNQPAFLKRVVLDHLSLADISLLPRFSKAVERGLIDRITPSTLQLFRHYFDALQTRNGESLSQAISRMYEMLSKTLYLSQSFKDAQVSDRAGLSL
jgi:midasin